MDSKELIYCGLGSYRNIVTGESFEKTASDMVKLTDQQSLAEARFVQRHASSNVDDLEVKLND